MKKNAGTSPDTVANERKIKLACDFGENLQRARSACGITQADLADLIGVSTRSITRWEAGEVTPTVVDAKVVADAIGTTVGTLLGEARSRARRDAAVYYSDPKSVEKMRRTENEEELLELEKSLAAAIHPWDIEITAEQFDELREEFIERLKKAKPTSAWKRLQDYFSSPESQPDGRKHP